MSVTGPILGAVLAGGASSRFGSDKAAAMLDGRTLLDHACAALAPFVDRVVVVGRGEVSDLPAAGLGPLGGIAGALDYAVRHDFASVLTIACDMPWVPAELLVDMLEHAPSYCADAPVLGHWPVELAKDLVGRLITSLSSPRPCAGVHGRPLPDADDPIRRWMPGQARHDGRGREGAFSVRRWAIDIGASAIPAPGPLRNVNTPADL